MHSTINESIILYCQKLTTTVCSRINQLIFRSNEKQSCLSQGPQGILSVKSGSFYFYFNMHAILWAWVDAILLSEYFTVLLYFRLSFVCFPSWHFVYCQISHSFVFISSCVLFCPHYQPTFSVHVLRGVCCYCCCCLLKGKNPSPMPLFKKNLRNSVAWITLGDF